MEINLLEEFFNSHFRTMLLEGFFSDNPKEDVEIVKHFITEQCSVDILLIRSDSGNGGSHLLVGAGNDLLKNDIKFVWPGFKSCLRHNLSKYYKDSFEKSLQDCSFCLIEYLDNIIEHPPLHPNSSPSLSWLQEILTGFIKRGGRIIFSASKEITSKQISLYFKTDSVIEANTSYPSLETLKLIGKKEYSDEFVEKYAKEAYSHSRCVRDFENFLMSFNALIQLGKPIKWKE